MAKTVEVAGLTFKPFGTGMSVAIDPASKTAFLAIPYGAAKSAGMSASGKSRLVASTKGNVDLVDGIKIGVNAYLPLGAA